MPKITPAELKEYTTFPAVKNRPDPNLLDDIIEAEADINQIVGHDFSDITAYPNGLPEEVKVAYKKMAQFFALINSDSAVVKGYSGEKIGDYSYTYKGETIRKPDVLHLLQAHIKETTIKRQTSFRMRSI